MDLLDLEDYPVHKDKQLYVLEGPHYCLPAWRREILSESGHKRLWVVWPAMELKQVPWSIFFEKLSLLAYARKKDYLFFQEFPDESLKPVPGATPGYWFRWRDEPMPRCDGLEVDTAEILQPEGTVDPKFMEALGKSTGLDGKVVRLIWTAFVQVSMQWLVRYRKPLNLGFCTLFAVPYRTNWKSVLLAHFPKSYSVCNTSTKKAEQEMKEAGITRFLRSRELLEINKNIAGWKLELVPSGMWQHCVEKVERQRMETYGPGPYAKHIAKSIIRMQKFISASYRHFVLRASLPFARVRQVGVGNVQELIPVTRRGGIRPIPIPSSSVVICADTDSDSKEPSIISLIEREVKQVSQLPDLRSQLVNLRISGGSLEVDKDGAD